MESSTNSPIASSDTSGAKMAIGMLWVVSLIVIGYLGYIIGQKETAPQKSSTKNVLAEINSLPTSPPSSVTAKNTTVSCSKSGYAQQWEYLKSYTIKENDNLPAIAVAQLHDESRVNEIMQINGVGPLVVGSTLYLPPDSVTKSAGKLKQVYGKLIEKNESMWHLSFNNDEKGIGVLIPTYWFENITNKDEYQTGDCLSILFDDGFKVFTVAKQ